MSGALDYAISCGDDQVAVALLKVAPKLTDLEKPDANAKTLLMKAVLQGWLRCAACILCKENK